MTGIAMNIDVSVTTYNFNSSVYLFGGTAAYKTLILNQRGLVSHVTFSHATSLSSRTL